EHGSGDGLGPRRARRLDLACPARERNREADQRAAGHVAVGHPREVRDRSWRAAEGTVAGRRTPGRAQRTEDGAPARQDLYIGLLTSNGAPQSRAGSAGILSQRSVSAAFHWAGRCRDSATPPATPLTAIHRKSCGPATHPW